MPMSSPGLDERLLATLEIAEHLVLEAREVLLPMVAVKPSSQNLSPSSLNFTLFVIAEDTTSLPKPRLP